MTAQLVEIGCVPNTATTNPESLRIEALVVDLNVITSSELWCVWPMKW
jgi:hypothetical protein